MTLVLRGKSRVALDVEELGDFGQPVSIEPDSVRRELEEFRSSECVACAQGGPELLIVLIQEVDGFGACRAGAGRFIVHCRTDSEVDSAHDQLVNGDGHLFVYLIVEHRDERTELRRVAERLLDLHLSDGELQLERDLGVEKLGRDGRLNEYIGIVGRVVREPPRRIGLSVRQLGSDLFDNAAIFPAVHQHGRNGPGILAVDENDLTDVIDESLDVSVDSIRVKYRGTDVDDVRQVSGDE